MYQIILTNLKNIPQDTLSYQYTFNSDTTRYSSFQVFFYESTIFINYINFSVNYGQLLIKE
jgi:hypothetical protein